jgi:ADP-ribose pyrophosphatase YjhB (NUDIX family)
LGLLFFVVVLILVVVIIVVGFRIIVGSFRRVGFLIVVVIVIGNHIHTDGSLLDDFEIRLAFETAQDLALFDLIFVAINFSAAFRATDHDGDLLPDDCCRPTSSYYIPPMASLRRREIKNRREYPTLPVVGVGGVVIDGDSALLIRRGHEPLKDQWSIPGGALELGETIRAGLAREMLEETGLVVRVGELVEVFERIILDPASDPKTGDKPKRGPKSKARAKSTPQRDTKRDNSADRPRYHFVILDYLCEPVGGSLRAGSDVTDARFVREQDLPQYGLTETAMRVLRTAFAIARARPVR